MIKKAGGCEMNGNSCGYIADDGSKRESAIKVMPEPFQIRQIRGLLAPTVDHWPTYDNPGPSGRAKFHPRSK